MIAIDFVIGYSFVSSIWATNVNRNIFFVPGIKRSLVGRAVPAEVVGTAHPTLIPCNSVQLRVVAAYAGSLNLSAGARPADAYRG